MPDAYWLTDQDVAVINSLLDFVYGDRDSPPGRPPDHRHIMPPEVYVARTPAGGIPSMVWQTGTGIRDKPGSAECAIYQLVPTGTWGEILKPVEASRFVYNLSTTAIPGNTWILVCRDKFGAWWVCGELPAGAGDTGTGTGPGSAAYIDVVTEVCLITTSSATGTGGPPIQE